MAEDDFSFKKTIQTAFRLLVTLENRVSNNEVLAAQVGRRLDALKHEIKIIEESLKTVQNDLESCVEPRAAMRKSVDEVAAQIKIVEGLLREVQVAQGKNSLHDFIGPKTLAAMRAVVISVSTAVLVGILVALSKLLVAVARWALIEGVI